MLPQPPLFGAARLFLASRTISTRGLADPRLLCGNRAVTTEAPAVSSRHSSALPRHLTCFRRFLHPVPCPSNRALTARIAEKRKERSTAYQLLGKASAESATALDSCHTLPPLVDSCTTLASSLESCPALVASNLQGTGAMASLLSSFHKELSTTWPPVIALPIELAAASAALILGAGATASVMFGIFVAVGVFFQPRWMIRFVRKTLPHIVFECVTRDKVVALTIDDGPNGETTSEILDILKDNNSKATFFVIGSNVDKYPELVERMHEEGHELGNHTMDDVASWRLSLDILEMSLLEVDRKLQKYFRTDMTGKIIKWFRPGHGWSTKPMRQLAESHGYKLALGSVFPMDPLFKKSGGPLSRYCLWKIYPGAIIILHDRPQQGSQTIEILRRILPELRQQGYQLVTLSEMTNLAQMGGAEDTEEEMTLVS